ncbi:11548_t:CDS:2 [Entrophospora sp. SA101]|nr:11548_t:CDS:2 [Entrophospora sp. SA101]CAJ0854666.1 16514_t:CDS:2 [Entrophospora sp. SA101]
MKGVFHTIIYLQRLSIEHFELILEFATWVLENDPENGMDTASDYHNQLVMIYLKKILELRNQDQECKNDENQAALSIYVHKLKNEQLAEEYCVKNYKVTDDGTKNVFMSLLRVYLHPSKGEQVMIEPALRLLSRYGSHVNAIETLNMLPASTKVSELYSFFEKYIRESHRNKSMNMIVKNLLKADQKQAEEQLVYYRSRRIKIDEDRIVFAVFPNNVVVHYKTYWK